MLAAVPTFFRADESLDLDAFAAHLGRLGLAGVRGILVCGSTGEFPTLDAGERMELAAAAVAAAPPGMTVVVHAGAASTRESVLLARHAAEIGAQGVAAITPYYLPIDAAALSLHLRRVKEACGDLHLLAYSFPARAGTQYPLDVLAALARSGVVSGVKESGPELRRLLDVRERCGEDFRVYAGAAELLAAAVAHGMDGGVLALANAAPRALVQAYDSAAAGDVRAAASLLAGTRAVRDAASIGLMPAGLKAVLHVLHGSPPYLRAPRSALDGAHMARVRELLQSAPPD